EQNRKKYTGVGSFLQYTNKRAPDIGDTGSLLSEALVCSSGCYTPAVGVVENGSERGLVPRIPIIGHWGVLCSHTEDDFDRIFGDRKHLHQGPVVLAVVELQDATVDIFYHVHDPVFLGDLDRTPSPIEDYP